jgi:serine/threonine-protein kinase
MKIIAEPTQPVTTLRRSVPANVAAAVSKALEKLPADRFENAKAFSDALANPSFRTTSSEALPGVRGASGFRRSLLAVTGLATALLIALAWSLLRRAPSPPVVRYGLALPPSQALAPGANSPTVAPDGSYLVYLGPGDGGGQLWLKRRDSYAATPIPGTIAPGSFTLSPDGASLAFAVGDEIKKVALAGGTGIPLVSQSVANPRGLAWLDDGNIVYVKHGGDALMSVSSNGGTPRVLWDSAGTSLITPTPLPRSRGVLFTLCSIGCLSQTVWVLDLATDSAHMIIPAGQHAVYASTGHIVYEGSVGGSLFAVPFDVDRLRVTGPPVSLGLQAPGNGETFSLSKAGTLSMLVSAASERKFEMEWVDRNGRETPVDTSWTFQLTGIANNHGWSLSPDGSRLAIGLSTGAGDDIWVKPLPTGAAYRLTFDPGSDNRPRWTADGKWITFVSSRTEPGVFQHRADGTGTDSTLVRGAIDEGVFSPDRAWLLLRAGAVGAVAGGRDITGVRLGQDSSRVPLLTSAADEEAIALSPDGKWLAYQSDETGTTEVFVRPFPNVNDGKKQVSSGGGTAPLWSRDGKELFYLAGGKRMMSARVTSGPALSVGDPGLLFRVPDDLLVAESRFYTPWDVGRDGRFIMARVIGGVSAASGSIVIVENWLEEQRRQMAASTASFPTGSRK